MAMLTRPPPSPRRLRYALPSPTARAPLFDFSSVSDCIIPRQEFCDRLVTVCVNHYRIIGYPICISNYEGKYNRNQFIFNFALVLDEDAEWDDYNTINLKLFPLHPPPAPVHAWHVPLLTIDLSSFNTPFDPHHSNFSETSNNSLSSDLTLTRILPWINGIRSVAHIALLADVALDLAKKAIQHLLLYGCVILLDILQFSASYACTPAIGALVENEDGVLDECARYVYIPWLMDRQSHSKIEPQNGRTAEKEETPEDQAMKEVVNHELRKETLTRLYTTLRQGVPLREWVAANRDELQIIDVRRLITFGVIKGFLYRVHKYALATVPSLSGESAPNGYESSSRGGNNGAAWGDARENLPLARYLDGLHCFDEICTELAMPEKDVLGKMRRAYGNVQIIQR
ncbi:Nitrogen permease regulator 2 [Coniosporium tulheliwenetii]|uniref:Nitrogen permease regulator 2 n=1 Tax=Coniosporium tulheliwenetii TaxID=3383036 RepID=A0ACC2ZFA5_9PEZI|nr:Nitrogen permease regulator 2 [Cladosporium sp. JES 115]